MKKIKMLRDCIGCDDGIFAKPYKKDEEYEVGDSLAKTFCEDMGAAEYCSDSSEKPKKEKEEKPKAKKKKRSKKASKGAPENKAE